jgi:hypothetical protein
MGAVFNRPFKWGTPSVGLFRFGDDLYNEQVLSVGFGNELGIASLGGKVNLIQYSAEGFGVSSALTIDIGGITELSEKLSIGAYITNLTQSRIGEDQEQLPTRLTAGLSYNPEKNVSITTEVTTWRTGLEYSFHQKVFFRTGFSLNPDAGFFGVGISKKKVRFDYAIQLNKLTGASHQASASYWLSQKGKDKK